MEVLSAIGVAIRGVELFELAHPDHNGPTSTAVLLKTVFCSGLNPVLLEVQADEVHQLTD